MNLDENEMQEDIIEARRVMLKESGAIELAANRLNGNSFTKALNFLMETAHKVVVTGIGKSGHVGKKIAATLSSTGTPAAFLHPSEAVHGDLGIHQFGDTVIFLSNSGSTPELIFLEPVFRNRNAKIIGLIGNSEGPLANKVDVCLDASTKEEADSLGIVPTASFAVASAIGDAIASALMLRKGFSSSEYAQTHPAGQLGRNLILCVEDVLHPPSSVAILTKDTCMKKTIIEMSRFPLGGACVVEGERLLGVITDGDLRRALHERPELLRLNASEIMTRNPIFVSPKTSLGKALEMMEKRSPSPVSILPVLEPKSHKFLGLIRLHDIYDG
jgi:arabinose-5-phosphate isomerase